MEANSAVNLKITSTAFASGQEIPVKYTCDGSDINPPIKIDGLPTQTQTLAIIMDDPDAPKGIFIHWLCWDLPTLTNIDENSRPGIHGINSFGEKGYKGPCPPRGQKHRYFIRIFALDNKLELHENATREELEKAIQNHIITKGELQGIYGSD
jgi:Raf kinase inhibitor-like YbhB/YbcL family protein